MNNKGQSLALFVVLLPVLLLLLVLIIDVGKLIILKLELNNISEIVLDYGLEHLEDETLYSDLTKLVKMNKNDIDNVNIEFKEDKIYLKLSHSNETLFKNVINIVDFKIETSYVGYMLDDKKRIERLGD